jgi:hypothetical protein
VPSVYKVCFSPAPHGSCYVMRCTQSAHIKLGLTDEKKEVALYNWSETVLRASDWEFF